MLFNPKDKIFAVKWWFGMQGKNKRQTLNFVLYLDSYTWSNHKVAHEWRLQSSKNRTNQLYVEHQVLKKMLLIKSRTLLCVHFITPSMKTLWKKMFNFVIKNLSALRFPKLARFCFKNRADWLWSNSHSSLYFVSKRVKFRKAFNDLYMILYNIFKS